MDITVVEFLSPTFRPGNGIYIRGKSGFPDMLFDFRSGTIYTTDFQFNYVPFTDVDISAALHKKLEQFSGGKLSLWTPKMWDQVYSAAGGKGFLPKGGRSLQGTEVVRSMKDLPVGTQVYYSDSGDSTAIFSIVSKDLNIVENAWYYELSMPIGRSVMRSIYYYGTRYLPGVTTQWANVYVPETMLSPMFDPSSAVRLYNIPTDYWGLADDATVATVSLIGALATGGVAPVIGVGFALMSNVFPVMKAVGGAMAGRWVPLWSGIGQAVLGTQLTQADVVGGGVESWGWKSLSFTGGRNTGFALANAGRAGVVNAGQWTMAGFTLLSISHLMYSLSDGQMLQDMGEYVPGMAQLGSALATTGDVAHDVAVRTGRAAGGTVGGFTKGFKDQDPETAAAIGSAFQGGTMTMALVVGTMLAVSGYNMMN